MTHSSSHSGHTALLADRALVSSRCAFIVLTAAPGQTTVKQGVKRVRFLVEAAEI